jgi:hypothetical protein
MRFTAVVDASSGRLFLLGNVTSESGAVLAGTSEAAQQCPAGAAVVPLVPLDVGGEKGKRRVVAACPARGGLLILVEDRLA